MWLAAFQLEGARVFGVEAYDGIMKKAVRMPMRWGKTLAWRLFWRANGAFEVARKKKTKKDLVEELVHSALEANSERCKELLRLRANPDAVCPKKKMTALQAACRHRWMLPSLTIMLLAHGANPNVHGTGIESPLMLAAEHGNNIVALALLENGANPNACGATGLSPLMLAAGKGDEAMVRALLEHGAQPNYCGEDGVTALMMAAESGAVSVVSALLPLLSPSDISAPSMSGCTAFMRAIQSNHELCVDLLWELSDKAAVSKAGETALMLACRISPEELVMRLLPHSDILARDNNGRAASNYARVREPELRARLRSLEEAASLAKSLADIETPRARSALRV